MPRLQPFVGLRDLMERQHLVDDGPDLSPFDEDPQRIQFVPAPQQEQEVRGVPASLVILSPARREGDGLARSGA